MAHLHWPDDYQRASGTTATVVRRGPHDAPMTMETIVLPPPARGSFMSKLLWGLLICGGAVALAFTAVQHLSGAQAALSSDESGAIPLLAAVGSGKTAPVAETVVEEDFSAVIQAYLDDATVSSVRMGADDCRAIINGRLLHVGDYVDPQLGLEFVGHDPDGEFLLFRDGQGQTYFLNLFRSGRS